MTFKSKFIYLIVIYAFVNSQMIFAELGKADLKDYDFNEGAAAYKRGDYATAIKKFVETAEKGDYRAMYALGSMYSEGIGVEQNHKEAYRWLKNASDYNYLPAVHKLGLMYDEGKGVSQNYKKAARLYDKAAKKGFGPAQYRLGLLYAKGHGMKQNNVKAYAWLSTAEGYFKHIVNTGKKEGAESNQGTDQSEQAVKQLDKRLDEEYAAERLESIDTELERIRTEITPAQLNEAKQLIQTYSNYQKDIE